MHLFWDFSVSINIKPAYMYSNQETQILFSKKKSNMMKHAVIEK